MTTNTPIEHPHAELSIQRIYVKDLSFEAPLSPDIFQKEWKPELNLQIQTQSVSIAEHVHEVTLKLIVSAKTDEKTAFLIEIKQAGIFTVKVPDSNQMGAVLGSICPGILFPYAREAISDLANRGTFPPLYLAPINFDALYLQHVEEQKKQEGKKEETTH